MKARRTLAQLGDVDVRERRTVTVLSNDEPLIAGQLLATVSLGSNVALTLDCAGMRVWVEALPGETEVEVSSS